MADKVRCARCGAENYASDPKCLSCGTDLSGTGSERICPKCGYMMGRLDHHCPRCRPMEAAQQRQASAPPVAPPIERPPVVSPRYSSVQCPYCKRQLPLDPPRGAGERVTCGACGRQLTLAHPPQVGAPGTAVGQKGVLYACGGCLGLLVLLLIGAAIVDKASAPRHQQLSRLDLSPIRSRIDQEITQSAGIGLQYRLHEVRVSDSGTLEVTLDLQSVPPSKEALVEDARNWAEVVALTDMGGRYARDVFGGKIDVTVWTMFSPDKVLWWGTYSRSDAYWMQGPGYKNFDVLTGRAIRGM